MVTSKDKAMKRQLVTPLVLLMATLAPPAPRQGREEFPAGPCAAPPPQAAAAGFTRLDFQLDPRRDIDIGWNNWPRHEWGSRILREARCASSHPILQDR